MIANVGSADRIFRLVVGAVLLASPFLPFTASFFAAWGAWKFSVAIVGAVLIGTAFMNFCPIYGVLGLSTRRSRKV